MRKEDLMGKNFPMNLHLFGHAAGTGGDGGNAGGDDPDGGKDKPDKDGDGGDDDEGAGDDDEGEEEKKYSEAEMEEAVKKRLNRERRKWQREQQGKPPASGAGEAEKNKPAAGASGDPGGSDADKKARIAEEKAAALEMKWTCLEHDVSKDCVDDVLALAKVHMAKDEGMDIEDAIDEVLKKYPQFKGGYDADGGGQDGKKGWGQRHGKPPAKAATVEDEIRKQMFGK